MSVIDYQYERDIEVLLNPETDAPSLKVAAEVLERFRAQHNLGAFFCQFFDCPRADVPFKTVQDREAHESAHIPSFKCSKPHCVWKDTGFKNHKVLAAHMQRYHPQVADTVIPELLPARKTNPVGEDGGESAITQTADVGIALADLNIDDLPAELKQSGHDWSAVYNPTEQRTMSIQDVLTMTHESVVSCVALSADGRLLATGSNRVCCVFGAESGVKVAELAHGPVAPNEDLYIAEDSYLRGVRFSPDSSFLVTGAEDR